MNIPAALRAPHSNRMTRQAVRTFDVAALRPDGSRSVDTFKAPALPLFDAAFSAFARGVTLASPNGPVPIEDLVPGDWVNTSSGEPAEVIWIGSSSFGPTDAGRRTSLVRIMADSFGQNRPSSFVTVGPSARVLQTPPHLRGATAGADVLTPINAFIDNVNVIEVTPPTPVRLFHICLTRHAAIDVGGMMMETFHPGMAATREISHAQRDLFLSMFPRAAHITDFGPLAHPRAPDAEPAMA